MLFFKTLFNNLQDLMKQNFVIIPCAGKVFCPAFSKLVWVVLKKIC